MFQALAGHDLRGKPFHEPTLFRITDAVEKATPFRGQTPGSLGPEQHRGVERPLLREGSPRIQRSL